MSSQSQEPTKELKGNESILLVDDEAIIIEVCIQYLEVLGYTVFTANSVLGAIETNSREFERSIC
jgi:CheY-like chemotaxis protein